jgi:hypothetical protein
LEPQANQSPLRQRIRWTIFPVPPGSPEGQQHNINRICATAAHGYAANISKSKAMIFALRQAAAALLAIHRVWNYEGSPIEVVSQYKQLIMLTSNCKWQAQARTPPTTPGGQRPSPAIAVATKLHVICTVNKPSTYGMDIWGQTQLTERLQRCSQPIP